MQANHSVTLGRLVAKPILKGYTRGDGSEGHRAWFKVAVTRLSDLRKPQEKRRTNLIPVECWGELAKRCAEFLDTGSEVYVEGELIFESRRREDGTGSDEYNHLMASKVQFGRKSPKNASPEGRPTPANALQEALNAAAVEAGLDVTCTVAGANPFEDAS